MKYIISSPAFHRLLLDIRIEDSMDFCVNHVKYWFPNSETSSIQETLEHSTPPYDWPKLDFIPAMQRRRLSPFAKIALYVANKTAEHNEKSLPIIFSSRHGDLHKTSTLLADLSTETTLSPTAFSLSVHNAIPSLYSILTDNKQALNAISAGKDTFFCSLVDAYARLTSGIAERILFIHADQQLPETYLGFKDEIQLPHAVSMILSLPTNAKQDEASTRVSLTMKHQLSDNNNHLPAALAFSQWIESHTAALSFNSAHYNWSMKKNA